MQEQRAQKDSFRTGKVEGKLMAQKKQEQEKAKNKLLDPEKDKEKLKELLLNVKPVEQPKILHYCMECGQAHNQKPEKECLSNECSNTTSEKGFKKKQSGTETVWVKRSEADLMNNDGFNKIVLSEIEPAISSTVAGGYLRNSEVSKLNYSTLSNITMQLALYPWKYGIDNPSDMQQIGDIIRPILISHTSKARGGRGLESTERTTMEKITKAFTKDDEKEESSVF